MKQMLKQKSIIIGLLSTISGVVVLIFSPENKEVGISLVTSGLSTMFLRHAIQKGK